MHLHMVRISAAHRLPETLTKRCNRQPFRDSKKARGCVEQHLDFGPMNQGILVVLFLISTAGGRSARLDSPRPIRVYQRGAPGKADKSHSEIPSLGSS